MKILTGAYQPDAGEILFEGEPVKMTTPAVAIDMGVNVIADDTGTGYFTAAPLDIPAVKTVKIKASRLSGDGVSTAFVKSLIKMAKERNIAVCARDIDNPRDLTALGGFDVDLIEGIFNGRPLRDKEFIEKMTETAV